MNEFQFKIPEHLKNHIKDCGTELSIQYGCVDNKVVKRVLIRNTKSPFEAIWDELNDKPFDEWYKDTFWPQRKV